MDFKAQLFIIYSQFDSVVSENYYDRRKFVCFENLSYPQQWSRGPFKALSTIQLLIFSQKRSMFAGVLEAATRGVLSEKVFIKISQKWQGNSFIKAATLFKKRPRHRCFPVNFAKFLRTSFFLQNSSGGLLLGFWIHLLEYVVLIPNWSKLYMHFSDFLNLFWF